MQQHSTDYHQRQSLSSSSEDGGVVGGVFSPHVDKDRGRGWQRSEFSSYELTLIISLPKHILKETPGFQKLSNQQGQLHSEMQNNRFSKPRERINIGTRGGKKYLVPCTGSLPGPEAICD